MAIVITLLVLDLGVAAGAEEDLLQAIVDKWPSYLAYFISFFTVGAYWLRHHAILHLMSEVDSAFIRLNLVALFFVSFLPYPTGLVPEFIDNDDAERVAVVFYGIVLLLAAVSFNLLWRYASHQGRLLDSDIPEDEIEELREVLAPSLFGYVIAILIGLVFPLLALAFYMLTAILIAVPIGTLRAALRNS